MTDRGHLPAPTGRPAPMPPPVRPELLASAASSARIFALLLICSLVMAGRQLPWGATSLLFSLPAVWFGIRTLRLGSAGGSRRGGLVVVGVGLALSVVVVASQLVTVVLWPVQRDYERCRADALGVTALQQCETERERRLTPAGMVG